MNTHQLSRRRFVIGAALGSAAASLGLFSLRAEAAEALLAPARGRAVSYRDFQDVWRNKWTWDKVVKSTHSRADCQGGCSWDIYVRDGIVWREEQAAIYKAARPDLPDPNPRGCQKGGCYSRMQLSATRITHPLKRVGERGEGKWKRIGWAEAIDEIADKMIDIAAAHGTEAIIVDDGTSNIDQGPNTSSEVRFRAAMEAVLMDDWAGVGDMPNGCVQTWGHLNVEGTSDNWFLSDYIVVLGCNPNVTRIPDAHYLHEARYRGAKLVVVAPDLSPSTVHADMWLNIRQETDSALGLAVAQYIVEQQLYNADFIAEQTDLPFLVRQDNQRFLRPSDMQKGGSDRAMYVWDEKTHGIVVAPGCEGDGHGGRSLALGGIKPALSGTFPVTLANGQHVEVRTVFDLLREKLNRDHRPEQAAPITGLNAELIRRFAREIATAKSAMITTSWGSAKSYHSDLLHRAWILVTALTGNEGRCGGGLRIAAYKTLDGIDRVDFALNDDEKANLAKMMERDMSPRDYQYLSRVGGKKAGAVTPLLAFLYAHAGYKELWDRPDLQDPAMPRPFSSYFREAVDKGWLPIYPKEGRDPKCYIFSGCNPLRRWPAPQIAKKHLWPKLDLIFTCDFRMSSTGMHADYILPAAAYYEKYGIRFNTSYLHYFVFADKATQPLGQSKPEWEIFGALAKRISERAKERGIKQVKGHKDAPLDLTECFARYTSNGAYSIDDAGQLALMDMMIARSPNIHAKTAREALQMGAVPIKETRHTTNNQLFENFSDYKENDTYWPHRDMVEKKLAWPTLTGRLQFYIDHPWFLEGGEALPTYKAPPMANSKYPLRLIDGHPRHSVHAMQRNDELLNRLQRGEPAFLMNPKDAQARGIQDGDRVRAYNATGEFECRVKVAASMQPGYIFMEHATEPFQFKNWMSSQSAVESPLKPLHLAGDYYHLDYRMYYGGPNHAPRGTVLEVEKVA